MKLREDTALLSCVTRVRRGKAIKRGGSLRSNRRQVVASNEFQLVDDEFIFTVCSCELPVENYRGNTFISGSGKELPDGEEEEMKRNKWSANERAKASEHWPGRVCENT